MMVSPAKEWVGVRYKFVWRLLIISNLALGAYMFATPRRKSMGNAASKAESKDRSTLTANSSPPLPVDVDLPISQNQQQDLLK
ncbi:hypothetical protein AgCh_017386 [Apium graveolens]